MRKVVEDHPQLFPDITAKFPTTRYQGSKTKLSDWIWEQIADLEFETVLDAFGGTGVVGYRLKQEGKTVTYNDLLRFNYINSRGLIENSKVKLSAEEIEWLLSEHKKVKYPTLVQENFRDVYFTDEENAWIDRTITNINQLANPYKYSLAFFALSQACIVKRPYNLFHRKNLYMRLAEVGRSFGNKISWDRPFEEWFRIFVAEANSAVFDNGRENESYNMDALELQGEFDLVYIDTPYVSRQGVGVDYRDFYHFLEGLTMYDDWINDIDFKSKHRRLRPQYNTWTDKANITEAFDKLFEKFQDSILVVSYRSDGIPSEQELVSLLKEYKSEVSLKHYGQYKYVLSNNSNSKEILLIGK